MSEYTDKHFSLDDWRLIQDAIVDAISLSNSEEETKRLEKMLEKVQPYTVTIPSGWKWTNKQ